MNAKQHRSHTLSKQLQAKLRSISTNASDLCIVEPYENDNAEEPLTQVCITNHNIRQQNSALLNTLKSSITSISGYQVLPLPEKVY